MNTFSYIIMNLGKITSISVAAESKLDAYRKIKFQYPEARIFKPIGR